MKNNGNFFQLDDALVSPEKAQRCLCVRLNTTIPKFIDDPGVCERERKKQNKRQH